MAQLKNFNKLPQCFYCNANLTNEETRSGETVCSQCKKTVVRESDSTARKFSSVNQESGSKSTDSDSLTRPGEHKRQETEPSIGQFGRFELKQVLGQGAFGRVYRAYDPQLDRMLALKVPIFSSEEKQKVARFRAEAKAAGQLRHPNIVPTFDSGRNGSNYFIASQFVQGKTLDWIRKNQTVEIQQAVQWTIDIAEALQYAHEIGILHRDVKPQNIMIDQRNEPQLMDFGLAKRINDDSNMTTDGALLGTPAYMSPEQARGDLAAIGPASDQYAVGAVLYELLCGQRLFDGPPLAVMSQILNSDPPSPSSIRAGIPRDLEAVVLKAINKEAKNRYGSLSELAEDLRRHLRNEPVNARHANALERVFRWIGRHPSLSAFFVALFVAVVSMSMGLISFRYQTQLRESLQQTVLLRERAELEKSNADEQRKIAENRSHEADEQRMIAENRSREAEEQRSRAEKGEDRSRQLLYLSQIRVAKQNWFEGNTNEMKSILASLIPKGQEEDLRSFEWYYLQRLLQGFDFVRLPSIGGVSGLAISPNGKHLALCGGNKAIRLMVLDGFRVVHTKEVGSNPLSLTWMKDSESFVVGLENGVVHRIGLDGKISQSSDPRATGIGRLACSNNGELLAASTRRSQIEIIDAKSLKTIRAWNVPSLFDQTSGSVVFSEDDRKVYTHRVFGKKIETWNVKDGKLAGTFSHEFDGGAVLYRGSKSPSLFAVDSVPARVAVIDLKTEKSYVGFRGNKRRIEDLVTTDDGTVVATAGNDATVRLWRTEGAEGSRVLRGHVGPVNRIAMDSSGSRIVSCDTSGNLFAWNLEANAECRLLERAPNILYRVALSRDGKMVATGGAEMVVRVLSTENEKLLFTLAGHTGDIEGLEFSHDGKRLFTASKDKTIRVWDLQSPTTPPKIWLGHTDAIWKLKLSPDGQRLASISHDKTVRLWNTNTGESVHVWSEHAARLASIAWDKVRNQILTCSIDGVAKAWSPDSATSVWTMQVPFPAGLSPILNIDSSGTKLVTPGAVIDYESKQPILRFSGNYGSIYHGEFTQDGRRVIVAGVDGSLRIWDLGSKQEMLKLEHDGPIYDFVMRPDGRQIISVSRDRSARIWDAIGP